MPRDTSNKQFFDFCSLHYPWNKVREVGIRIGMLDRGDPTQADEMEKLR